MKVAYFIAIQILRTRAQREMLSQMNQGMRAALPLKGVRLEDLPDDFYRNDEQVKADSIWHLRMAKDFVPLLLDKDWSLNASHPGTKFFVSDNPVMRRNYYPSVSYVGNDGIASEGIQIYLPLSAELILCLLCGFNNIISGEAEGADSTNSDT